MFGPSEKEWNFMMLMFVVGVLASLAVLLIGIPYGVYWLWTTFDIVVQ